MTSPTRIRQLRIADVRARILDALWTCRDVLSGQHKLFRALGGIRWLAVHPDKTWDDYVAWRDETKQIAAERKASLEKRLARVERIARAL